MAELPTELLDAYSSTAYVVSGATFPMVLMVGTRNDTAARLLQSRGLKSALFITAHNPWGQRLLPEHNLSRHHKLVTDMNRHWELLSGFGVSPRGDWPAETGVLVLCDKPQEYENWLRSYRQNAAILVTADGDVSLLVNSAPPVIVRQAATLDSWPPLSFAGFPEHERLCFYPSCGNQLLWAVMRLDADLFVFTDKNRRGGNWAAIEADFARHCKDVELLEYGWDYLRFRSGDKTGLLLWEDNNDTLDRLQAHGCKVHHFVGICDGCCEGGNHECVHERPFVKRLMRVAADEMRYITDHSRPLQGMTSGVGNGMHRHYDFQQRHILSHFGPPPDWNRSREEDTDDCTGPDAEFELLALVNGGDSRDWYTSNPGLKRPPQLRHLRRFGPERGISRLAEYAVKKHEELPLFRTGRG